jgi:hypothetical protein
MGGAGLGALLLAACIPIKPGKRLPKSPTPGTAPTTTTVASTPTTIAALASLPGFDQFAATVHTFAQGDFWMIESSGLPAHDMMVGISSWQQQVPLPQPYRGTNAWRIPATPVLAATPVSAKTGLFRGAIALAVNGVPIFNALNNRGDDAFLAGELDQWGGHAGRADDYHYHVAPLHLSDIVGKSKPIAYALDGYAIYGRSEPDGSPVTKLDDYNGHVGPNGVYHYHGTTTYPYINGGLRGIVTVSDQVDPQPILRPLRPAGEPLRGAVINGFSTPAANTYQLAYSINGANASVRYEVAATTVKFTFTDASGAVRNETYTR